MPPLIFTVNGAVILRLYLPAQFVPLSPSADKLPGFRLNDV